MARHNPMNRYRRAERVRAVYDGREMPQERAGDENPPEKVYLLSCGHFGIKQFLNGEEFCQQCFDEYDELCKEVMNPASPGRAKVRHIWYYCDQSLAEQTVITWIKSPIHVEVIKLGYSL